MSAQLKYSTSRKAHPNGSAVFASFLGANRETQQLLLENKSAAGCYVPNKLSNLHPCFASLVEIDDQDEANSKLIVSTEDERAAPAIVGFEALGLRIDVKPRRDIIDGVKKSQPLLVDDLAGTSFAGRQRDNLCLYAMVQVIPFGFEADIVVGAMGDPATQERMENVHGEWAGKWMVAHADSHANAADIATILGRVEGDLANWLGPDDVARIVRGAGGVNITPISKLASPAEYESVQGEMALVLRSASSSATATSNGASVSHGEKQAKASMVKKMLRLQGTLMAADISIEKQKIRRLIFAEMSDEYKDIATSDLSTSECKVQYKELIDSTTRMVPRGMEGHVLMSNRTQYDCDPNMANNFCLGNINKSPIEDLTHETSKVSVWSLGRESELKIKARKKKQDDEDGEENVGEDATNRAKKRIIVANVTAIVDEKGFLHVSANGVNLCFALVNLHATPSIFYILIDHLSTFVASPDIARWIDKYKSAMPQFWMWLVSTLDDMLAGLAEAGSDQRVAAAIEANDIKLIPEGLYEKVVARFFDQIDDVKRKERNKQPIDYVPIVCPDYLKPDYDAKRQRTLALAAAPAQQMQQQQRQGRQGQGGQPFLQQQRVNGNARGAAAGGVGARSPSRSDMGTFVLLDPSFRNVFANGLQATKCKSWFTLGISCRFGTGACKFSHESFDKWAADDQARQIAHVRKNMGRIAFNAEAVKSLGPENADLLRNPDGSVPTNAAPPAGENRG